MTPEQREKLEELARGKYVLYLGDLAAITAALERIEELEKIIATLERRCQEAEASAAAMRVAFAAAPDDTMACHQTYQELVRDYRRWKEIFWKAAHDWR